VLKVPTGSVRIVSFQGERGRGGRTDGMVWKRKKLRDMVENMNMRCTWFPEFPSLLSIDTSGALAVHPRVVLGVEPLAGRHISDTEP